ncbi:MAG TPA: hypothetical protein VFU02_08040 [Polyangiaceae bacterium]|nr:hypothetical protein [Polyangiaceae bacterium]
MKDWQIITQAEAATASLRGVFRLESPEAYDVAFGPILAGLNAAGDSGYTVDITNATLMNSSGIRALADLVLRAKRTHQRVVFVAKRSVPWQAKTMATLQSLHAQLQVNFL